MRAVFFGRLTGLVLLAVALGVPGVNRAHAAPLTIAVILPKQPEHLATIYASFQKKFPQLYGSQPAPRFYLQTPNDDYLSLRNSARKAIALDVDLILAFGSAAAMTAKAETFQTPVLFADAIEPEGLGLVTQNKRDSQLASGVRGNAPLQTLFKMLRDLTNTTKLALVTDGDPIDKQLTVIFKDAAGRRGLEVVSVSTREKPPSAVLQEFRDKGIDGLLFVDDQPRHLEVLRLALEKNLPAISVVPEMADHGALLVMEVSSEEQGEVLAEMTVRVLNGEYPESIPVATPRKTGVVINLKSSQQCDLPVPFEVLSQATRVIR
jgi:putative ABC transport system substrate-binding protein